MEDDKRERLIKSYEARIGAIPDRYVPKSLSFVDLMKQLKNLEATRKSKSGVERPMLKSFKSRESRWTKMARERFGEGNTSKEDIAKALAKSPKERLAFKRAFDIIYDRGAKAYATAGSRPNQTPASWGQARVFRNLFSPIPQDKDVLEKYGVPIVKSASLKGSGSTSVKNILTKRSYPDNFDSDVVRVIKAMSFDDSNVKVAGSVSYRSNLYWSDYDLIEVVKAKSVNDIVRRFKAIVRRLSGMSNVYVGDIKCGEISEWRVIDEMAYVKDGRVYGYDKADAIAKLNKLKTDGVITGVERLKAQRLLKEKPSVLELEQIKKDVRFHILRWKVKDVMAGYVEYRGRRVSLRDAISSPALFKIDTVAYIDGMYVDFSIIYDCRVGGERVNDFRVNPRLTLEMDIDAYSAKGEWFKVAKRMFSLANMNYEEGKPSADLINKLIVILNSDLGILYQVISRINTIIGYDEVGRISKRRLKDEIDDFKMVLGNVYSSNAYLKAEDGILAKIEKILSMDSVDMMVDELKKIERRLSEILSLETNKRLIDEKVIKS